MALKELGEAARNLNAVASLTKNAFKLWDDVKGRANNGIGPAQRVAATKRDFAAFRLKVVSGLLKKGWTDEEVAELIGASPIAVKRTKSALDKIEKVLGPGILDMTVEVGDIHAKPAEEDEEDVAF